MAQQPASVLDYTYVVHMHQCSVSIGAQHGNRNRIRHHINKNRLLRGGVCNNNIEGVITDDMLVEWATAIAPRALAGTVPGLLNPHH